MKFTMRREKNKHKKYEKEWVHQVINMLFAHSFYFFFFFLHLLCAKYLFKLKWNVWNRGWSHRVKRKEGTRGGERERNNYFVINAVVDDVKSFSFLHSFVVTRTHIPRRTHGGNTQRGKPINRISMKTVAREIRYFQNEKNKKWKKQRKMPDTINSIVLEIRFRLNMRHRKWYNNRIISFINLQNIHFSFVYKVDLKARFQSQKRMHKHQF